jgi:hypothetical protein
LYFQKQTKNERKTTVKTEGQKDIDKQKEMETERKRNRKNEKQKE